MWAKALAGLWKLWHICCKETRVDGATGMSNKTETFEIFHLTKDWRRCLLCCVMNEGWQTFTTMLAFCHLLLFLNLEHCRSQTWFISCLLTMGRSSIEALAISLMDGEGSCLPSTSNATQIFHWPVLTSALYLSLRCHVFHRYQYSCQHRLTRLEGIVDVQEKPVSSFVGETSPLYII
jgi:hypothetical protein